MNRLAKARSWYEKQLKMSTIVEGEEDGDEDFEDDELGEEIDDDDEAAFNSEY